MAWVHPLFSQPVQPIDLAIRERLARRGRPVTPAACGLVNVLRFRGPFILSTEANGVVSARARKLGVDVLQDCPDKAAVLRELVATRRLSPEEVAYVGNDVNDRGCLEVVDVPVCVADAYPSVLPLARLVTSMRRLHDTRRD